MKKTETKIKRNRPFLIMDLLHALSKEELNRFAAFVASPYFNTDVRVSALLKQLKKNSADNKIDESTQVKIYQHIFPNHPSPKIRLNQQQKSLLMSVFNKLTRLSESFLSVEGLQENAACKTELLCSKLLEKNQSRFFNRYIKKEKKQLAAQQQKGIEHYEQQVKVEFGMLDYLYKSGTLLQQDNLRELTNSIDTHYLLQKLKIRAAALSINDVVSGKSYDFTDTKTIAGLLNLPQYTGVPLIQIYQAAINLIETNDTQTYKYFLALLDKYSSSIPRQYLNDFYMIISNFYKNQILKGDTEAYQKVFQIYKIIDEKDLLGEGGMLMEKLKNMVTVGCREKAFEWAVAMTEKYDPMFEKAYSKSVYQFNMGTIAFYQNDFKKAFSHFIKVEKINLAYDLGVRVMLLKTYYELDSEYDERTIHSCRSAERFIKGNKVLGSTSKKGSKNFIRILINIYRIRHRVGKITTEKVRATLDKFGYISDKQWLLEKVRALEAQKRR